jgi:hypothetical protein
MINDFVFEQILGLKDKDYWSKDHKRKSRDIVLRMNRPELIRGT